MRTEYRVYAYNGDAGYDVTEDPREVVALQNHAKRGTTVVVLVGDDGTEQVLWENKFPRTPLTYMGQEGFKLVERT